MKKLVSGALILVIGLAIGYSLSNQQHAIPSMGDAAKTYAMNVVVSGVPFWNETRDTWAQISASQPNVTTLFGGPLDTDAQKQIDEVEALIAADVDGIVIAPADSAALTTVINKAVDSGIPVVTYLVDAPNGDRLTYITSELESSGELLAEYILEKLDYSGNVLISYAEAGNEEQERRVQGFRNVISKYPNVNLAGILEDQYDENVGSREIKTLLLDKSVDAILGANSRSGVGAVIALRENGYTPGDVLVGGWDYDADLLNMIEDGWVQASVAQQSTYMTQLAFSILDAENRGYLYPIALRLQEEGISPLPEIIKVPVTLITKENTSAFIRQ